MLARSLLCAWLLVLCGWSGRLLAANDPRPIVGPGASKDDVINAYGWPNGQSHSGTKEILNYTQGQVTLDNGKVERVDFNMNIPWPAPKPRPGAPTAGKIEEPIDFWVTSYDEAAREAARRNARILALFTGSDWSPASKRFQDEVAFQPEFVNAFTADFVFLRLDLPSRAPIAAELKEQNTRLRERYQVTTYPALLVLSPQGRHLGTVDLMKDRPGETYRERVIAAVRELRDQLIARPPPPDPLPDATVAPAPANKSGSEMPAAVSSSLRSARSLVIMALAAGALLAGAALWLLWRRGSAPPASSSGSAATRISDAAGGLPARATMLEWPREKLCAVVAGLAETDGYRAEVLPAGGDVDVMLKRRDNTQPQVIVCCAPGAGGSVAARRVRELFGSMTAVGVATGWFVAPAGFSNEARSYATEKGIVLIDAAHLATMLRNLSPLLVSKVMARRL